MSTNVFKNYNENRLRAGWRILIFLILFWCFSAVSLVIKPLFGDITKREFLSGYSLVIVAILAIGASIAVPIARKYLDKKSFKSLGLTLVKRSWLDILFGFLLSALMAGLFLITTVLTGVVEIQGINYSSISNALYNASGFVEFISIFSLGSMLLFLLEHTMVGYWEELVFRGYLFQNMRDGMGLVLAVIISCLIYGIIHILNPNATILSSSIIVLFGFLRIYGYLVSGMLWLSMGMHMGWNFFQGPIFGFAASGHQKATFLELSIHEPEWLSGGEFGPEGSVLIIPILLLALYAMNFWGKKSKEYYNETISN